MIVLSNENTNNFNDRSRKGLGISTSSYKSLISNQLLLIVLIIFSTELHAQEGSFSSQTSDTNNAASDYDTTTNNNVDKGPNHKFCGLDWSDISKNCLSSQPCPTGQDSECTLPGATCFTDTLCDSSKGHGKYYEYLGIPYEDTRNQLFCASRFINVGEFPLSNCSPEYWCKDGECPDDLHCFGVAGLCNIQDLVRESIDKGEEVAVDYEAIKEYEDNKKQQEGDDKPVEYRDDDPKRSNFCGMTWDDADWQCSDWCPEGTECPEPQSCFADTGCYYDKDLYPAGSEEGSSSKGQLSPDSPKRSNFCGRTWEDASTQCGDWCPDGTECEEPYSCFADTSCYYDKDISPSESPTTYKPTTSPTITYSRAENMSFCGMGWNDAADKCSISRHCPNGDIDCPGSETCWNYLPGCNIVDLMKESNVVPTVTTTTQNKPAYGPASPPSRPPSRQPTSQITPAPVRPTTNAPTKWTIQWIDDEETGEEDWSESAVKETNLYCGETLIDAATNCRKSGYHCPDGICSSGLKCFAIAEGDCGDGASNIISTILNPPHAAQTVTQTTPPASSPSDDIAETFYCGTGPYDASFCRQRCRSGSSGECPGDENCYGYITCTTETLTPSRRPTQNPTKKPSPHPVNNVGWRQNYCAKSKASLELSCINAVTCNEGEPPCPEGLYCWGDYLCGVETTHPATLKPTDTPTTKPTARPTKTDQQSDSSFSSPPELYCAFSESELETICHSAQSCSRYRCPDGMFCFPYTCANKKTTNPKDKAFLCATNEAQLVERCGVAQDCTGNSQVCPEGQYCLKYDCKQSLDKCPLMFVGWHSAQGCNNYWYCSNGVVGEQRSCDDSSKFDKVRGRCISGVLVNEYCYGPPLTELELQGTTPPNLEELCPNEYEGWNSSKDCKEYYECKDGGQSIGPTYICGKGTRFDKVRNRCFEEAFVDSLCMGPVLSDSETSLGETVESSPSIAPSSQIPVGSPLESFDRSPPATASPVFISKNEPETPPWLEHEIFLPNEGILCIMNTYITWLIPLMLTIILLGT